jgi:Sortilin, neurotensin receptor 3,
MKTRQHLILRLALPLMALTFLVPSLSSQGQGNAQQPPVPLINQSDNPLLSSFKFRSIGPASMGGRIDDIAVSESDPSIIYLGYAVGGVFRSENNGTTFEPVFETYGTASIGDIAIHPSNPNIVYVGTGEPNNRQTSSFGDGIYKTTDGGKTFTNIGLRETQTIARIVIDPKNPETVYVASPGHLFGPNPERGIFKTTDGGKNVGQDQVHRQRHGLHRHRNRSQQPQHPVCGELSAAAERLLLQRWRSGKRGVEDDRRGQNVDEAHRQRAASRHVRPHCDRRLTLESERRHVPDRRW